jgi:hypothetical protein
MVAISASNICEIFKETRSKNQYYSLVLTLVGSYLIYYNLVIGKLLAQYILQTLFAYHTLSRFCVVDKNRRVDLVYCMRPCLKQVMTRGVRKRRIS